MTSGTHALILAQSAFEAVCKERDEALAKLSTVHLWIEKNLSGGFINSLTYLQNLECVADDWYEKLVATIRQRDKAQEGAINYFARIGELEKERDEARERAESKHGLWMDELARVTELEKQLEAMREVVKACMAAMPVGNIQTHTPENLASRIGDLAHALASETNENEALREAIKEAYESLNVSTTFGTTPRQDQVRAKLKSLLP